jgi:hypothetical protein
MISIGKIAAYRRNYKPVEAFDAASENNNIMTATLGVVVVSGPEWYENAKKMNRSFYEAVSTAISDLDGVSGKRYLF